MSYRHKTSVAYDHDDRGVSNGLKLRVLRRDGYRCSYCGVSGQDANLEIDHRIPHARGGDNHISNLYTACAPCNRRKGTQVWKVRENYSDTKPRPSIQELNRERFFKRWEEIRKNEPVEWSFLSDEDVLEKVVAVALATLTVPVEF